MREKWNVYLLIISVVFVSGCGDNARTRSEARVFVEVAPSSSVPVEADQTSSVPDEVAMAVAEIERDFEFVPDVITNHWSQARGMALGIREKIMKLPCGLSEQYARRMADGILSFPIDHLPYYDRSHALDAMWDMVEVIGWRGIKPEGCWELRILRLKRLREAIEYVQNNEGDRRNWSYLTTVSNNLNGYSEFWERDLAYRVSKAIPPNQYACEVREVPDEEYRAIRKRFEEFLGRPIRSYEEIVRVQRERDRQSKLARERRPTDSDVKVDVGDL